MSDDPVNPFEQHKPRRKKRRVPPLQRLQSPWPLVGVVISAEIVSAMLIKGTSSMLSVLVFLAVVLILVTTVLPTFRQ
jgi:cobalamin synthase